jgi:hypothetical protein
MAKIKPERLAVLTGHARTEKSWAAVFPGFAPECIRKHLKMLLEHIYLLEAENQALKSLMALICPKCNGPNVLVLYTAPPQYECRRCGAELEDLNCPGIPVYTEAEFRRKRPALYGEEVCDCCVHAPHEGECMFCKAENTPHIPVLRVKNG